MSDVPPPPDPGQPWPEDPQTPPPPPPPDAGGPPPPPPPPPPVGPPPVGYTHAAAPFGVHPTTGIPYSDKSKIIAGILQLVLPFGIGRFYLGDTKTAVLQLVVAVFTCGIGSIWSFVDGIIILVTDSKDPQGRILRS